MIVTDASVWVSRFLTGDAFYVASSLWLKQHIIAGLPLLAPANLLAEVAGAVARRSGSSQLGYQAAQQVLRVPTLQLVSIGVDLGDFAAAVASTYRLRGADALYVAVARRLQVPLVSWDQEQVTRIKGFVEAYTPNDQSSE
jgi:predicted nucleic acid-binding protein